MNVTLGPRPSLSVIYYGICNSQMDRLFNFKHVRVTASVGSKYAMYMHCLDSDDPGPRDIIYVPSLNAYCLILSVYAFKMVNWHDPLVLEKDYSELQD
jgi:hypothetical protein